MSTPTHPPVGGLLARLARVHPLAAFLSTLAVVLLGLFAPGIIGAGVLTAVGLAALALTLRTWPVTAPRTRVARLVILCGIALIALVKIS